MAWTTDKRACKALYFSLQRANQIDLLTEFDEAGKLTMKDLLFFNVHASDDMRRQEAVILSFRLNNEFVRIYKAKFEKNETEASAISKMTELLLQGAKTVEDLSDVVDACYKFRDEQKANNN
ncbi:MAG: hypothetical protein K2X48_14020 [Chitinophagaceae bacterium]|nr:hypothetical protein [Chitinophagaceae bacterium]